jgi:hypothetical protein
MQLPWSVESCTGDTAQFVKNRWSIDWVVNELLIGHFILTHQPKIDGHRYGFAGHLHPAVMIFAKDHLK